MSGQEKQKPERTALHDPWEWAVSLVCGTDSNLLMELVLYFHWIPSFFDYLAVFAPNFVCDRLYAGQYFLAMHSITIYALDSMG
jgi:hypothetical protein